MPEINEVTIMSESLNAKFGGKTLLSIQWFSAPGKKTHNCTYALYSELEKKLPLKLEKVWNKGKKIIFEFVGDVHIICSPLMTGSFVYKASSHRKYQLNFDVEKKEDSIAVFNDTRGQGLSNIYFTKVDVEKKLAEIGPDYLHGNITIEDYKRVISGSRIKNKEICSFLMEQKYFSGVGNYLCSEILYTSKILPTRLLKDLTDDDITNLYNNSMKIIKLGYDGKGLTIKNYLTPDGEPGTYKCVVYGRSIDDNNHKVLKGTFSNKRTSHYVPEVQK
jgi:DNA-formamidopyrimidine glycosylase